MTLIFNYDLYSFAYIAPYRYKKIVFIFSPSMEDDKIVVSFVDWSGGWRLLGDQHVRKIQCLRGLPPQTFSWSRAPRKASGQNGNQPHVPVVNVLLKNNLSCASLHVGSFSAIYIEAFYRKLFHAVHWMEHERLLVDDFQLAGVFFDGLQNEEHSFLLACPIYRFWTKRFSWPLASAFNNLDEFNTL